MAEEQEVSGPDLKRGVGLSELVENEPLLGHVDEEAVLLVRRGDQVFAVAATCTHYGGPLAEGLVVGDTIRCPWHHARFNMRTGEAEGAPALNPISCFQTRRDGDRVTVTGKTERKPAASRSRQKPASVVIVGAGAAGAACADMLRMKGYGGTITMIAEEDPSPVDRPNFSKDYLAGTAPEEWIPLRTPDYYKSIGVDLVKGTA
ncbi:MAG TPA: Rieske 2Fe-2S domain-containing protein, partial [Terriglobales bacterium]